MKSIRHILNRANISSIELEVSNTIIILTSDNEPHEHLGSYFISEILIIMHWPLSVVLAQTFNASLLTIAVLPILEACSDLP